jgi:hypothetical protein
MWVIMIAAGASGATEGVVTEGELRGDGPPADSAGVDTVRDVWTAAAYGNLDAVKSLIQRDGVDMNAPDPTFGITPLGWATTTGQPRVVGYLLDQGADPNGRYRDENTPLHTAAFFGRPECAELLLKAGAALGARNQRGETPWDSMAHDRGTTEFIAGLLQLPIDFEQVRTGRDRVATLFDQHDPERDHIQATTMLRTIVQGLIWIPFFHHLWFLWFLCWLVLMFAIVTALVPRMSLPSVIVGTPSCLLWLVPLTMITQSRMHFGGAMPGFGPDTSAGLLPMPHVLAHYAIFFFFGAIVYTTPGAADRLGRRWYVVLPVALLILPFALALSLHLPWGLDLVDGDARLRELLANVGQVLYAWLMIFGLMGLFETLLARERPRVRYLSDSSYWLYLVHLPLIIVGQALLRDVDLPALVKLGALVAVVSLILLVSYEYLVRYTRIGRLLNGPRTR